MRQTMNPNKRIKGDTRTSRALCDALGLSFQEHDGMPLLHRWAYFR